MTRKVNGVGIVKLDPKRWADYCGEPLAGKGSSRCARIGKFQVLIGDRPIMCLQHAERFARNVHPDAQREPGGST